jgi:hypothetical protein
MDKISIVREKLWKNVPWAYCPSGSELPSAIHRDCLEDSTDQTTALSGSRWILVRSLNPSEHTMDVLFLIPEGKGNVLQAVRIADTRNTILAPSEGARACHVVCEVCRLVSDTQQHRSRVPTAPCISIVAAGVC